MASLSLFLVEPVREIFSTQAMMLRDLPGWFVVLAQILTSSFSLSLSVLYIVGLEYLKPLVVAINCAIKFAKNENTKIAVRESPLLGSTVIESSGST